MNKPAYIKGLREIEHVPVGMCELAEYLPLSFYDADFSSLEPSTEESGAPVGNIVARIGRGEHYEIIEGGHYFLAYSKAFPNRKVWVQLIHLSDQDAAKHVYDDADFTNVIDQAHFMKQLMLFFGWNQRHLGEALSLKRSTVAHRLRLLNLDQQVAELIRRGRLPGVCGKYLCSVSSPAKQRQLAKKAIANTWTTDELYKAIHPKFETSVLSTINNNASSHSKVTREEKEIHIKVMEEKLSEILTTKIEVNANKHSDYRGTIDIAIHDVNNLIALGDAFFKNALRSNLYKGNLSLTINDLDHLNDLYDDLTSQSSE